MRDAAVAAAAAGRERRSVPELSGQVALVTGASTGIGRDLVQGLAARGMSVAGMARNQERLAAAMSEVADAPAAAPWPWRRTSPTRQRWTPPWRGWPTSSAASTC